MKYSGSHKNEVYTSTPCNVFLPYRFSSSTVSARVSVAKRDHLCVWVMLFIQTMLQVKCRNKIKTCVHCHGKQFQLLLQFFNCWVENSPWPKLKRSSENLANHQKAVLMLICNYCFDQIQARPLLWGRSATGDFNTAVPQ